MSDKDTQTLQCFPRGGFIDSTAFPGQRMAYPIAWEDDDPKKKPTRYLSIVGHDTATEKAGSFRPGGSPTVGASESFIMDGGRAYVNTGGPLGFWAIAVVG